MSSTTRQLSTETTSITTAGKWKRRRDIPIAILAWIGVVAVILWAAGHIIRSLLILASAALLAYALSPAVKFLQRFMPRFLAILLVYLLAFSGLSLLLYLIISNAIHQIFQLSHFLRTALLSSGSGQPTPLEQTLISFGISQTQINDARQQIIVRTEEFATSAIPLLRGVFDFVLDTIIVAVMSIYLVVDGGRVNRWLRSNMPLQLQDRVLFFLDTLERIVGGYIRGQFTLAFLIGLLVGIGMFLFQVPYAILLGVLAFIFAFVPVLGTFISGAVCVLLALTKGWLIALLVLLYFVAIHVFEGDIVGPRIVGKALGLHPIISLTALVAGAELFGIWGALFASPIAGILQALIATFWIEWRTTHPDAFQKEKEQLPEVKELIPQAIESSPVEKPVSPSE
jgi:predicted PurR-regulated permease PerM